MQVIYKKTFYKKVPLRSLPFIKTGNIKYVFRKYKSEFDVALFGHLKRKAAELKTYSNAEIVNKLKNNKCNGSTKLQQVWKS